MLTNRENLCRKKPHWVNFRSLLLKNLLVKNKWLKVYGILHLPSLSQNTNLAFLIDQEGIKNKISIDREVSRRYRWQKDLNRSKRYRASIKLTETTKNWLDGSSYLSRGIKNKPRNLNKRGMYRGAIELLSRRYQASIEKPKIRFFKEENKHKMNVIKINTKISNQEAC